MQLVCYTHLSFSDKLGKIASQLLRPISPTALLGTIVGVGSVESAFFIQTIPCISSFTDPDIPVIMVYMECLCALEVCCIGHLDPVPCIHKHE